MGKFVIVAYTPKSDKADQLLAVVRKHWQILRDVNLITDRPAYIMRAKDGTIVEVFEWLSEDAIKQAHSTPAVQALWTEFAAVCDYRSLKDLAECQQLFAEFEPV
jgi:quinol monooxygenase YgiN